MARIVITHTGNFEKTTLFFNKLRALNNFEIRHILNKCGEQGVAALASATPVRTGKTAASWGYSVEKTDYGWVINWHNTNINEGVPIAIILQYGHGTGTGGYVQGIDYINPSIRPVFESMANNVWKEVKDCK